MAAGRIKGITVEIGGDTTKLQTALQGVNKEIKSTQSQLKDVEKLLKLDPGNTELLAQKHKLLGEAVGETKQKLETLKTAAEQANAALANGEITQAQYDALQREIIETEADLKKLESQASTSAVALEKISQAGEKMKSAGEKISSAGEKLLPVTAGVTGLGTAAVTTAASFESSMSQVQATMGITKDAMSTVNGQSVNTMDTLSNLAKKMGAETSFSAKQCGDALNFLALAGYDTQQMCDTLPTVLNLAAAGSLDLATASDMVTDAMSALGMGVDESEKMVDQMAKTASTTNTSVAQLGEGILTIGATAKTVKGGTAELNTALGILANNGIKGAEGGTHLRNMILSLQNPTDKAAICMESLGLQVYDSEGNMRSLNDILGDLNKSMDGMTAEEKSNVISKIFNKTDLSSVNALLANTGDTWDNLQNSITNSAGAAQQMADTQLDNLQGQLTILQSALEGLAISIGELLMPYIKQIVAHIQSFVDWLNSLDEGSKKMIITIGLIAAALGPVLIVIGKVVTAVGSILTFIPKIVSGFSMVGKAFSALGGILTANPLGLIVVAIVAVVAALVTLYQKCEWFRDGVNAIFQQVASFFQKIWSEICVFFTDTIPNAWNALVSFFQGIPAWWSGIWQSVGTFFSQIWSGICSFFTDTIPNAWNSVASFFTSIPEWWAGIWQSVSDFFSSIWTGMMNNPVLTAITDMISQLWSNLVSTLQGIWSGLVSIASGAWELLKNTVLAPVLLLIDLVTGNFEQLASDAQNIWLNIQSAASQIWSGIQQVVGSLTQGLVNHVTILITGLGSALSNLWSAISGKASEIWSFIVSNLSSLIQNLVSGIVSFITNLATNLSNVWSGIKNTASSVWASLQQQIQNLVQSLVSRVVSFITGLSSNLSNLWSSMKNLAITTWTNLKNSVVQIALNLKDMAVQAFRNLVSGIRDALWNLPTTIRNGFSGAISYITSLPWQALGWGRDLVQGIANGIWNAIGAVRNAVSNVASVIRSYLHFSVPDVGPLTEYESWMPDFMKGLAAGIEKSRGMVEKAIGHVSSDLVLTPELGNLKSGMYAGGSDSDGGVTVNVPLFLDGRQIASATSTIQSQRNTSYKRSLGVV